MSQIEVIVGSTIAASAILLFMGLFGDSQTAEEYTRACNLKNGVALQADSHARRQCLLNVATPLILEVAK